MDKYGRAVIFKNNAPRYLVIDLPTSEQGVSTARTEEVLYAASKFMDMYDEAFKELAKWLISFRDSKLFYYINS